MISILATALALLLAVTVPRFVPSDRLAPTMTAAESWLRRYGAWTAAAISVAVVWYVWGQVLPIAKIQDEASYLLQSEIFARGRWTLPSPALPEFFEQPHVLVVPAVASKYPPGHALLLTPGTLVGFPPLVPLLLTAVTAVLIFALAMRVANPWVALLTWFLWLTSPIVLKFQPSYLSEVTTGALMLASWWLLLRWRDTGQRRWLLLVALAVGWSAITRPLTALAFAIPIAVVVLRDTVRLGRWRDLGTGVLAGVAVLAILPLWSARTTGDWRLWPVDRYRLDYMPFDKPGFTMDETPPRRAVSPVVRSLNDYFAAAHRQHTPDALPEITTRRVLNLVIGWFQNLRLPLLVFAVAGLFAMTAPVAFAAGTALLLFAAHLSYAHDPSWTVYYLEMTPVVAAVIALGVWRVSGRLGGGEERAPLGSVLVMSVLVVAAVSAVPDWRRDHLTRGAFDRRFARALDDIDRPAIVFLRYSPRLAVHPSVVFNGVEPERVRVWVVHDLGPRNAELRRLAPDRAAFALDEEELLRWAVDPAPRPLPLRAF